MVTIYSHITGNRIEYIVKHIFNNILGTDYVLTHEVNEYLQATGACINYSPTALHKGLWIHPHSLLSKEGIAPPKIEMGKWNDLPCFFLQPQGDIPFDLFAASFYLLTRYEEYETPDLDRFGRFVAESSIAYHENFLHIPVVDCWAAKLKELLTVDGDTADFKPPVFRMITTFDVDFPYRYRNKGLLKNLKSLLQDVLHGNFSDIKELLLTQLHLQPDPYMKALMNIDALHKQCDRDYFLFIHVGRYGKYDKRTIYPLRKYYRYLRTLYNVRFGLHPSFAASFDASIIQQEKEKLEDILGFNITRNRQHFLRIRFPFTGKTLNKLDFTEDFTLIHASQPGFRAGTAIPFYFFDLQTNQQTSLLLRPTIVMDTTFTTYLRMPPDEASRTIKALIAACKLSGGDFTMLWHPSTLAGTAGAPWYKVFIECFLYGVSSEKTLPLSL